MDFQLAPVVFLDFVLLLLLEHRNHIIDGLLHLREGIKFDTVREKGHCWIMTPFCCAPQGCCSCFTSEALLLRPDLEEVECTRHRIPCIVLLKNCNRLSYSLDLLQASSLP